MVLKTTVVLKTLNTRKEEIFKGNGFVQYPGSTEGFIHVYIFQILSNFLP